MDQTMYRQYISCIFPYNGFVNFCSIQIVLKMILCFLTLCKIMLQQKFSLNGLHSYLQILYQFCSTFEMCFLKLNFNLIYTGYIQLWVKLYLVLSKLWFYFYTFGIILPSALCPISCSTVKSELTKHCSVSFIFPYNGLVNLCSIQIVLRINFSTQCTLQLFVVDSFVLCNFV